MGPLLGCMKKVLSGMFASSLVQSSVPLPSSFSVTRSEDPAGCLTSCLEKQRDCYSPAPLLRLKDCHIWLCFLWSNSATFSGTRIYLVSDMVKFSVLPVLQLDELSDYCCVCIS